MQITVTKANGKSVGVAHIGDRVLYTTPQYLTNQMALTDARCWVAFHAKDAEMHGYGRKLNMDTPEMATAVEAYRAMRELQATRPVQGEGTPWAAAWRAHAQALNEAGRAAGVRGRRMMTPSTGVSWVAYQSNAVYDEMVRRAESQR